MSSKACRRSKLITEILIIIPIVLLVVLNIVLMPYFEEPMIALLISLGIAGGVTFVIGKVGTKVGIFREEEKK